MRTYTTLLLSLLVAAPALAAPLSAAAPQPHFPHGVPDDVGHPVTARRFRDRQEALAERAAAPSHGRRHRLRGRPGFVELEQEREDRVFTMLVEFGTAEHPLYPGGAPGPSHNEIPRPDRRVDNVTAWERDYDRRFYRGLMRDVDDYLRMQSSGRYAIDAEVTDWVQVPFNMARYGRNSCGLILCPNMNMLVRDALVAWVADQQQRGRGAAEIRSYLQTLDRWDRDDHDGDGDFDEPDGYIDHFALVHAGTGKEIGSVFGQDAIWTHRSFAFAHLAGSAGPDGNLAGGVQIGDTGVWVGDYMTVPENSGLGVVAHEHGHMLGLPDHNGGSAMAYWSLMSLGSYLGRGRDEIGDVPCDLSAWDKLQLGWLTHDTAHAGDLSYHLLGPAEYNSRAAQALLVVLPDRERVLELADPPEGEAAFWSGRGDLLEHGMTRAIDVPAVAPVLGMLAWYEIEPDFDYAYVAVSADGGATWEHLAGNITTDDDPNGQNRGHGITGVSGGWVPATFDLAAYAGRSVLLRVSYVTDLAIGGRGFVFDALSIGSLFDGAEQGAGGWTTVGFTVTDGAVESSTFNAYLAEYRQYRSYDRSLRTGPYSFGWFTESPNLVEHFPYQDGLLVHYWDAGHTDTNTAAHPGEGLVLPVDAHPDVLFADGGFAQFAIIQSYDSTFGLEPTDPIVIHRAGVPTTHPSLPAVPLFDDLLDWYRPQDPRTARYGVDPPKTGTRIRVLATEPHRGRMHVLVSPSPGM